MGLKMAMSIPLPKECVTLMVIVTAYKRVYQFKHHVFITLRGESNVFGMLCSADKMKTGSVALVNSCMSCELATSNEKREIGYSRQLASLPPLHTLKIVILLPYHE